MRLPGLTQLVLIVVGSVVFAAGLGPPVIAGIDDIVGFGPSLIVVTNAAITVLFLAALTAGIAAMRDDARFLREWTSGVRLGRIVVGSLVAACASFVVATTDHQNNTAWRFADKVETGAGVSDSRAREFGRYFARLAVNRSQEYGNSIGRFPVNWNLWATGGQSNLLIRIPATDSSGQPTPCLDDSNVRLSANAAQMASSEVSISAIDLCGRWHRADIEVSAGVTRLDIDLDQAGSAAIPGVDVMILEHRSNVQWLWNIATLFSITMLLAVVSTISLQNKDQTDRQEPAPEVSFSRASFAGLAILLFVVLGNAFVYSYVSQERTIYTWDFAGYWASSVNVSQFLQGAERKSATKPATTDPEARNTNALTTTARRSVEPEFSMPDPGAVAALIRNFRFAEYNVSSNLPIAPILAVFGGSRLVYELSLLNIYALAAVVMLILAIRACAGNGYSRWPAWWPLVPVATVFCFVPFWVPILRGYMGISIVGLNFAVLWLYFRQPVERISSLTLIAMGTLLLAGVMLQRWNAYWVVAFLLIVAIDSLRILFRSDRIDLKRLIRSFRAPIVIGFSALFLFATIAWPKVVTTVATDYADIYSAYLDDANMLNAFVSLVNAFGGGLIAIVVVGVVYLITDRSSRRIAILLGIQVAIMYFHFSGTQTFGPHQMYLLMPGLFIVLSLALLKALSSADTRHRVVGASASLLIIVTGIASGTSAFTAVENPATPKKSIGFLSQSYRPPLVRNDLDEFVRMVRYIDAELEEGGQVYVIAGSQTLNAGHFKNVGLSTGNEFASGDQIMSSAVVDKRDGFPRQLLRAQIIVTSDPVQFSRSPADQQVIRIPAESLLNGVGIGLAFEQLPATFTLDGDVDVRIFRRARPNTPAEIADMSEKLKAIYPDRPEVYE